MTSAVSWFYGSPFLSAANHIFDPCSQDDGRQTMDDAPPSIVYRL
jgi:hypothetical protein